MDPISPLCHTSLLLLFSLAVPLQEALANRGVEHNGTNIIARDDKNKWTNDTSFMDTSIDHSGLLEVQRVHMASGPVMTQETKQESTMQHGKEKGEHEAWIAEMVPEMTEDRLDVFRVACTQKCCQPHPCCVEQGHCPPSFSSTNWGCDFDKEESCLAWQEVLKNAKEMEATFKRTVSQVAHNLGINSANVEIAEIKKYERANQIAQKGGRGFCGITDLVRATYFFYEPNLLQDALVLFTHHANNAWQNNMSVNWRVLQLKNNFILPRNGYRDANILLEVRSGKKKIIGEIQLHMWQVHAIKSDGPAQALYNFIRWFELFQTEFKSTCWRIHGNTYCYRPDPIDFSRQFEMAVKDYHDKWYKLANYMISEWNDEEDNQRAFLRLDDESPVYWAHRGLQTVLERFRFTIESLDIGVNSFYGFPRGAVDVRAYMSDQQVDEVEHLPENLPEYAKLLHEAAATLNTELFKAAFTAFCGKALDGANCDGLDEERGLDSRFTQKVIDTGCQSRGFKGPADPRLSHVHHDLDLGFD